MTPTHVPAALRQTVVERAMGGCEYCLYPQAESALAFEVEHIIAQKHGGTATLDNLALSCPHCNRFKGTDLGSLDPENNQLTPFFNPRTQKRTEHFQLDGVRIAPLTPEGRVTVAILQFNHPDRLRERQRLIKLGLYP